MKNLLALTIATVALTVGATAQDKEVTLIAPGGIRAAVEQMIPAFDKKSGYKVKATFGSGPLRCPDWKVRGRNPQLLFYR